jgi:hypothetical protein
MLRVAMGKVSSSSFDILPTIDVSTKCNSPKVYRKKEKTIIEIVKENQTPIGLPIQIGNTRCTMHTYSSIVEILKN